ncbi:hypothetical protein VNO77_29221 [Canavalia gladiata]|uniref:Uncharacterized protein n=1 Tax=Canavalia gladiata TaxID=3824 RepID=A0AAN9KWC8_CANGL
MTNLPCKALSGQFLYAGDGGCAVLVCCRNQRSLTSTQKVDAIGGWWFCVSFLQKLKASILQLCLLSSTDSYSSSSVGLGLVEWLFSLFLCDSSIDSFR